MINLELGHIQNATNIPIVPFGYVEMYLNTDATVVAIPYGQVLGGTKNFVRFYFDSNSDLITPAQIWSNQELNPQSILGLGTWYIVNFFDATGTRLNNGPQNWQFTQTNGSTVDIGTMVSTAQGGIFYPFISTLVWEGTWDSGTNYIPGNTVFRLGSSYVSVSDNIGIDPSTDGGANWQIMAQGVINSVAPTHQFCTSVSSSNLGYSALVLSDIPNLSTLYLPLTGGTMTGTLNGLAINTTLGFRFNGGANSGHVLRGNGTNFVDSSLAAGDLSDGVTGTGAIVLANLPTIVAPTLTGPQVLITSGNAFTGYVCRISASGDVEVPVLNVRIDSNAGGSAGPALFVEDFTNFASSVDIVRIQTHNGSDTSTLIKLLNAGTGDYISGDSVWSISSAGLFTMPDLVVSGHISGRADIAGYVVVLAGNSTQAVVYSTPFTDDLPPVVALTPVDDSPADVGEYWVTHDGTPAVLSPPTPANWTGFTVNVTTPPQVSPPLTQTFSYLIVGVRQ